MSPSAFLATLPVVAALSLLAPLGGTAQAQITVLTVGPDGDYGTIQAAIDAAVVGDDTEIRVEAGTYIENISLFADFSAGSLALLGG